MVQTGPCDRTCGNCASEDTVTAPANIVGGGVGLTPFCRDCRFIYTEEDGWHE